MVTSQVKQSPVNRHQQPMTAKSMEAANRAFGSHMYIRPQRIKSADLKHRQLERSKPLCDFIEARPLPESAP